MEYQGPPSVDDDLEVDHSLLAGDEDRAGLRRALGFPDASDADVEQPVRPRRRRFIKVEDTTSEHEPEPAPTPIVGAELDELRRRVEQVAGGGQESAWRGDLNQLYAAMSDRLRVHGEEVTRQLAEERERLAELIAQVVEHVGSLADAQRPAAVAEQPAVDLGGVEHRMLAKIEEITHELAGDRDGLVGVVSAIEKELQEIRAGLAVAPTAAIDLAPVLEEVRALGRVVASAVTVGGRVPGAAELRDLVLEATRQVRSEELAMLQRSISELSEREASGAFAAHDFTDAVVALGKELDERLGAFEATLDGLADQGDEWRNNAAYLSASLRSLPSELRAQLGEIRAQTATLSMRVLSGFAEIHSLFDHGDRKVEQGAYADRRAMISELEAVRVALDELRAMVPGPQTKPPPGAGGVGSV